MRVAGRPNSRARPRSKVDDLPILMDRGEPSYAELELESPQSITRQAKGNSTRSPFDEKFAQIALSREFLSTRPIHEIRETLAHCKSLLENADGGGCPSHSSVMEDPEDCWVCQECAFKNHAQEPTCQSCGEKRQNVPSSIGHSETASPSRRMQW